MIYIKKGVRIHGLRPEIVVAIVICHQVYVEMDHEFIITSGIEGKHMRASLHYTGGAFNVRSPATRAEVYGNRMAEALGDDFDVVLEDTSIHVEWQPKDPYD